MTNFPNAPGNWNDSPAGSRVRLNSSFCRDGVIPAKPTGRPVVFSADVNLNPKWPQPRRVTIRVGSVSKNRTDDAGTVCPGLHIELWHLIMVLLSFWENRNMVTDTIHPSFNSVWRRFTCSNSRPSRSQLEGFAELMDELTALQMGIRVEDGLEEFAEVVRYGTKRVPFNFGNIENVFTGFSFHPAFYQVLLLADRLIDVRLDVLGGITSRYVRAGYLWLPARACRHQHERPVGDPRNPLPIERENMAVISSAELWQKLGEPNLPRWERKRSLLRNENSVLRQWDGLPLLGQGLHLGVASWDADEDFFIGTYTYPGPDWLPGPTPRKQSTEPRYTTKLAKAFIERGGGSKEAYFHWLARWKTMEVEADALERMKRLRVENIEGSLAFYRQAICLIGPDKFRDAVGLLGESDVGKAEGARGLFSTILLRMAAEKARVRTEQFLAGASGQLALGSEGRSKLLLGG